MEGNPELSSLRSRPLPKKTLLIFRLRRIEIPIYETFNYGKMLSAFGCGE